MGNGARSKMALLVSSAVIVELTEGIYVDLGWHKVRYSRYVNFLNFQRILGGGGSCGFQLRFSSCGSPVAVFSRSWQFQFSWAVCRSSFKRLLVVAGYTFTYAQITNHKFTDSQIHKFTIHKFTN